MNPSLAHTVGRGPHPKYGDKVNVCNMKKKYLKSDKKEEGVRTQIYQATLLNKEFAFPLNVVVILKTDLCTQTQAHVILFSTDLDLSYEKSLIIIRFVFKSNSISEMPNSIGAWMIS